MPARNAALVALNRFGFGARLGDLAKAGRDPREFLKAELDKPGVAVIALADTLMGSGAAIRLAFADLEQRKLVRAAKANAIANATWASLLPLIGKSEPMAGSRPLRPAAASPTAPGGKPVDAGPAMSAAAAGSQPRREPNAEQRIFRAEAMARFDQVAAADAGFVERMVNFWSNHFCVSARKSPLLRVVAGAFEREAIRPFVLGRFADMLRAVTRHPAMLVYLDNQVSVGPGSRAGRNRGRGLNENLAREVLELHTLGSDGGYTQADVTAFARVLTGWTMVGRAGRLGEPGSFVFSANAHEPGDERILGKTYVGGGEGQGESVLDDIARHPATVKHVVTKFARHFVADEPPPALVARLTRAFLSSGGDLMVLAHALVDAPDSWAMPLTKMRSPYDFLLAARRALHPGPMADPGPILGGLNLLGQPLWQPPGPNGFPDIADAWISAEGMKTRLDIAARIGRQTKDIEPPGRLVEAILGDSASAETRQAITRAESKQQAVALLLMSPEFQRR